MPLKWTNEPDAALLLARIDKQVKREGGHWSTSDLEATDNMHILASLVLFPKDVPDATRRGIVLGAIGRIPGDQALSPALVLAELEKGTREYLSLPAQPFVLLTTASLRLPTSRVVIRMDDGDRIVFTRGPAKGLKVPRLLKEQEEYTPPKDYSTVRVHVCARCELSAFDRALTTLDYLRSVWNLFANRSKTFRWSSSARKKPVNELLLGPVQTVHRLDGTPAGDGYWSDTQFRWQEPSSLLVTQFAALRKFEKSVRRLISRVTYLPDFADAIVRYGRALDDGDMAGSFLKLWVVLEQLVSRRNEEYRVLARRASFILKDQEYHEMILRQLATARNEIVHHAHTPEEGESLVFQLKGYVEAMFWFVLGSPRRFANVEDFLAFLQLPRDTNQLKRRLDMHSFAYRIRTRR